MENGNRAFKKVTGERVVAAIIDSIITTILTLIPTFIVMFKDGLSNFAEEFINSSTSGASTELFGTTDLVIISVIGFVIGYVYFAYVPYKWNGQTLGKRIMSIKAIDEFGNNPSLLKHSLRAVQIWDVYVSTILIPLLLINLIAYSVVSGIVGVGVSVLYYASFIMILVKADGRGLHDILAGTYVVKVNIDLDQEFVEKTTQMGDWAEVDYDFDQSSKKDKKDDWYE